MKKSILIVFSLLIANSTLKSQPLPVMVDTAIHLNYIMPLQRYAVRIAKNPIDNAMYYATYGGNLYKIRKNGTVYSDTLIASVTQHYINFLLGLVFRDSAIYLVGNHKVANTAGYGLVVRGKFKPNGTWAWDTIMHTAVYQSTTTLYDHSFSSICLSPNGDSLYIGSGSRTDHGEKEEVGGLYPNTRDVPLTSKIFSIPINPPATIYLPNDSATLDNGPYVYCRGVRNSFDMAIAPNGDLLAVENSGDRDDPEEMNWLRKGKHFGFPWRMGGNATPMQYPGYNANNDKLINHRCLGWGNGTTTSRFYNDSAFPQVPVGLTLFEPVRNYGPDADKFRDPVTGSTRDASNEGTYITSFTSHRSPLGLVFDNAGKLAPPYNRSAFALSYTEGSVDSTGNVGATGTGPFSDVSEDLLQLALYKDTATGQYSMNCYKIAYQFKKPADAFLDDNVLWALESHTPNDTMIARLYTLTFPLNTNATATPILGKDTTVCAASSLTILPKLKGQYKYLWSTGATTAQITIAPTITASYWLKAFNGLSTLRDTIIVTVSPAPATPSGITTTGGATKVCPGDVRTYTVALVAGVTFNWTVPTGAVITSGQGTRSINVTYNSGFIANGVISVTATKACGTSAARNLTILRNAPATPSAIIGATYGLCGLSNIVYSVTNVAGVTYTWTIPAGTTLVSGQGTNSIAVTFPATNFTGTITVKANNACGSSAVRSITPRAIPATPTIINGPATVCSNSIGNAYTIAAITSATNYTWTGPTGSRITGNGITSASNILTTTATSVTVNYATVTATSTLRARANNACGVGGTRSLILIPCTPRLGNGSDLNQIAVYPNPSDGLFNLVLNAIANTHYTIIVNDVLGKQLFKESFHSVMGLNEHPINLHPLSPGIYILTVRSATEEHNIKITKE